MSIIGAFVIFHTYVGKKRNGGIHKYEYELRHVSSFRTVIWHFEPCLLILWNGRIHTYELCFFISYRNLAFRVNFKKICRENYWMNLEFETCFGFLSIHPKFVLVLELYRVMIHEPYLVASFYKLLQL